VSVESSYYSVMPAQCPACATDLEITQLQCPACGTEIAGRYALSRLARLREPHASLLELFLRVRGNIKEMERELGLSYPTVRARLEEALSAAGLDRLGPKIPTEPTVTATRMNILNQLEQGEITAAEAVARLRDLKPGRSA
jgi:hypothetical protein